MDDGAVSEGETPPPSSEQRSYSDAFREVFPWYMAIGMSYDQFWHGDPYLAVYYREAHELYRDQKNQELWLNGWYTFAAISTALSNIHLDGKKHKFNEYMSEPFRIRPKSEEELEAEQRQATQNMVMKLNAIKAAFDEAHKEPKNAG